jgi:hypothetical protein
MRRRPNGCGRAARPGTRAAPVAAREMGDAAPLGEPVSNFAHADYLAAVEKAKDYIRAGDIFQVVPSQRWSLDFPQPPFALYRALQAHQPLALHVLLQLRRLPGGGRQPRDPRAGLRRRGHDPPHRGHPQTRRHPGGGPRAGGRPAGRRKGTGRAPDAAGPGPQRRGPGGEDRHRAPDRGIHRRALFPRDAHRVERGGRAVRGARRALGPAGGSARGHGLGRAQGPRDGDHRRAGARKARRLRRRRRLFQRGRRHGHVHRAAHRRGAGRHALHPGGRRRGL